VPSKHASFWLDLRILLDTVKIILGGRESAESEAATRESPARTEDRWRPRTPVHRNGATAHAPDPGPAMEAVARSSWRRREMVGSDDGRHVEGNGDGRRRRAS
jgi:hypothetical protein